MEARFKSAKRHLAVPTKVAQTFYRVPDSPKSLRELRKQPKRAKFEDGEELSDKSFLGDYAPPIYVSSPIQSESSNAVTHSPNPLTIKGIVHSLSSSHLTSSGAGFRTPPHPEGSSRRKQKFDPNDSWLDSGNDDDIKDDDQDVTPNPVPQKVHFDGPNAAPETTPKRRLITAKKRGKSSPVEKKPVTAEDIVMESPEEKKFSGNLGESVKESSMLGTLSQSASSSTSKRMRVWTKEQREFLESEFEHIPKPSKGNREAIAQFLGVTLREVSNWYNNRRSREKKYQQSLGTIKEVREVQEQLCSFQSDKVGRNVDLMETRNHGFPVYEFETPVKLEEMPQAPESVVEWRNVSGITPSAEDLRASQHIQELLNNDDHADMNTDIGHYGSYQMAPFFFSTLLRK